MRGNRRDWIPNNRQTQRAKRRGDAGCMSMVGATFPTAPSVRIAKSRQFSMPKGENDESNQTSIVARLKRKSTSDL